MSVVYSIIIPTHNSAEYIIKLLDSIPFRDDIEVIIIDDHSDDYDQLKRVIGGHKLSIKSVLISNSGIQSAGAARNQGLKLAKGKWVVFADSDDYFTDSISMIFDKHENTNADIIFFTLEGNHITHRVAGLNKLLVENSFDGVRYRHVVPWGKIINREMINKSKMSFSEVLVSNDEMFSAEAGVYAKEIIIESLTGYYSYEREGSLTMRAHDTRLQDIRMNEIRKKYILLNKHIGQDGICKAGLSIYANIRKAVSVGGLAYGLSWYLRIRSAGGRLNLAAIVARRLKG